MDQSDEILRSLDNSGLRKGHIKTMVIAGMGFFTDAYLLFVLTVAMPILASPAGFNLNVTASGYTVLLGYRVPTLSVVEGAITSAALFGAFVGAFIFGNISDRLGRKAVYGIELGIIIAFTIISAFSVNSTVGTDKGRVKSGTHTIWNPIRYQVHRQPGGLSIAHWAPGKEEFP